MTARIVRIAIASVFALLVAAAISWYINTQMGAGARQVIQVTPTSFDTLGGPFTLTDHTGAEVTDTDFHGQYLMVYFGFTYCPDVCPTELSKMMQAVTLLPDDLAAQVTPVLVTIDPERDTPDALAQYVALFGPTLVGLTGTTDQINQIADDYNVYHARVEDEDDPDFYLMDHSVYTYLVGPDGRVRNVLTNRQTSEQFADAIRQAVEADQAGA